MQGGLEFLVLAWNCGILFFFLFGCGGLLKSVRKKNMLRLLHAYQVGLQDWGGSLSRVP